MTIRNLLEDAAGKNPDSLALMYRRDKEWQKRTYGEMLRGVREMGEAYGTKFKLHPQRENTALMLPNGPEWMECYLAQSGAGVSVVPLDPKLREDEVAYILENSGAVVITTDSHHVKLLENIVSRLPALRAVVIVGGGAPEKVGEVPAYDYESLRMPLDGGKAPWYDANQAKDDDVASVIYTSGTTGKPKGAMLTHGNFTSDADGAFGAIAVSISSADTFLVILPLFHAYAFCTNFVVPMVKGCAMFFNESLRTIGDDIKTLRPSVVMAVPLLAEKMYDKIKKNIQSSFMARLLMCVGLGFIVRNKILKGLGGRLRFMIVGGAPCPKEVLEGYKRLGINLLEGYGLTECSPVVSIAGPECARIGTIGHKLTNIEIRLADQNESGVGELQVKGPIVMKGYWKNEEATRDAFDDGWLRTGDLADIGPDGLITIRGRKKALIVNREGKNIYPEEVENCIGADPILQDLVVIGYKVGSDPGEHVGVIIHPNEDLIKERTGKEMSWEDMERMVNLGVRQRCAKLADYKRPRKIVVWREPLERTSIQKVRRVAYQGKLDEK